MRRTNPAATWPLLFAILAPLVENFFVGHSPGDARDRNGKPEPPGNLETDGQNREASVEKVTWDLDGFSGRSEFKFPAFRYQIIATPTMVRLFLDQPEAGFCVDVAGSREFALRPEDHFPITHLLSEAHAFTDQALTDA